MALVWCDGFEVDFANNTAGFWDSYTNNGTADHQILGTARTGDGGAYFASVLKTNHTYLSKTLPSNLTEFYCGFGVRLASITDTDATTNYCPIMTMRDDGGTRQLQVGINLSNQLVGVLRANADGTVVGATSTALTINQWHYIELHILHNTSTGICQLRIDNDLEVDLSNVNTSAGPTRSVEVGIPTYDGAGNGSEMVVYLDDFVMIDTTGSVTNSWPDGAGVWRLDPDGDGNYSQWTSTGVNDYTEIDDVASFGSLPDGDTTKLTHAVVGERTSTTLDDLGIAGVVKGIQVMTNNKLAAAGADQMATFLRISSTDYDNSDFTPSTSFAWQQEAVTASPATSVAWTVSEINGMELGVKIS